MKIYGIRERHSGAYISFHSTSEKAHEAKNKLTQKQHAEEKRHLKYDSMMETCRSVRDISLNYMILQLEVD